VAQGTGVLLNNEMDDFSSKPGVPNAYGLVGNEANAIAAEKRPLSSMTPSFIESEAGVAILGTPGGSRIITMVFLGMLEHLQEKPVENWVDKKRFHHQYLPDVIQHEPDTFTEEVKQSLLEKGHKLKSVGRQYGNMHAIYLNKQNKEVTAASDKRAVGLAKVLTISK
jgi:gamma-glutamyltranspeptidase/glutathione hydrolase